MHYPIDLNIAQMTKCLTLLLAFVATSAAVVAGDDWRIDIYDRAQALVSAKNRKLMALLMEAEPKLSDWCDRALAREDAKQKVERYGFIKRLREKPESITSSKPSDWIKIFNVMGQEAADVALADPAFDKILREYLVKRKASGSMNPPSELYEPIREKLATASTLQIEVEMYRSLERLADEAAKKKAEQTAEPTAPNGRGSA